MGLSGDYADLDWTDPAVAIPGNARTFKATAETIIFEVIGKASTAEDADQADVGAMVVDAWVGWESRSASTTGGRPAITRGQSVVEATGGTLGTRIRVESTGATRGDVGRINLTLTGVAALTAVDVVIVSGARPL